MNTEPITLTAGDHTGVVSQAGVKGKKKNIFSTDFLFADLMSLFVQPDFSQQMDKNTSQGEADLKKGDRQSVTVDPKKTTEGIAPSQNLTTNQVKKNLAKLMMNSSDPAGARGKSKTVLTGKSVAAAADSSLIRDQIGSHLLMNKSGKLAGPPNGFVLTTDKQASVQAAKGVAPSQNLTTNQVKKDLAKLMMNSTDPAGTPEKSKPVLMEKSIGAATDSSLIHDQMGPHLVVNKPEKLAGIPNGFVISTDKPAPVRTAEGIAPSQNLTTDQVKKGLAKLLMNGPEKQTDDLAGFMIPAKNLLQTGSAGSVASELFLAANQIKSNQSAQRNRLASVMHTEKAARNQITQSTETDLNGSVSKSQEQTGADQVSNTTLLDKILIPSRTRVFENLLDSGSVTQTDLSVKDGETLANPVGLKQMSHAELLVSFSNPQTSRSAPSVGNQIMQQFVDWMGKTSFHLDAGTAKSLTVTLSPQNLGQVTVTVMQTANGIVAHLIASTKAAKDLINSGLGQLRNDFASQGIVLNQLDVSRQWPNGAAGETHQTNRGDQNSSQQDRSDEKDENQKKKRIDSMSSEEDTVAFLDWMKGGVPNA